MASFIFVGDPNHGGDGPQSIDVLGYAFNRTKATPVTNDAVIKKLDGNSHFERADAADPDEAARPTKGGKNGKGKTKVDSDADAEDPDEAAQT